MNIRFGQGGCLWVVAALVLVGWLVGCAPSAYKCTPFEYSTQRNGQRVQCRLLWCDKGMAGGRGGPATLFCDPVQ